MARISLFNQKGGVGKTTSVLNLAAALHRRQNDALLIDLDPQGHLTQIYAESPLNVAQSLFAFYQDSKLLRHLEMQWEAIGRLIPSHRELVKVDSIFGKGPAILNRLNQGLETLEKEAGPRNILMDCCPYVGVLSLGAIFASDLILVPISSDYLSLQGAKKVEHTLRALEPVLKRRVNRRYVMTCYDRRRRMTAQVHEQAQEDFPGEVCMTVISENVAVAESPRYKMDVFRHQASSTGAQNYDALLSELMEAGLVSAETGA